MNEGFQFADLIIMALVAGFVLLRLRSMMGKHTDLPEKMRDNPLKDEDVSGNVHELRPGKAIHTVELPEDDVESIAGDDKELARSLKKIKAVDSSFHSSQFLEGAKSAFEMVLEAYGNSDRKTLKMLLAPRVFEEFNKAIRQSKENETKEETTLVAIESAAIKSAELRGKTISVVVEIVSEQIHVTRDKDDEIIAGNPSHIELITDIWTFERQAGSSDPNWKLVATQD